MLWCWCVVALSLSKDTCVRKQAQVEKNAKNEKLLIQLSAAMFRDAIALWVQEFHVRKVFYMNFMLF